MPDEVAVFLFENGRLSGTDGVFDGGNADSE